MKGQERRSIPAELARGREQFQAWRQTHKVGTRFPDRLWTLAVKLAAAHGICRTAAVLGVVSCSLKKRVDLTQTEEPPATAPSFLEFSPPSLSATGGVELSPPSTARECIVEFEDAAGASMRVRLTGYDASDLVALGRSFWNGT